MEPYHLTWVASTISSLITIGVIALFPHIHLGLYALCVVTANTLFCLVGR